ncbi:ubiquinol oxidase [Nematocida minor]|uniref:ubiquinol oxidase n=1 Tax=Nematocida minor TaxID=1912983 RepID=UPI00221EE772|nr:ubiquinol oxidase [Nematocida minor]KAI5191202.1 ubiquinol oxidase [Nematocida minor]
MQKVCDMHPPQVVRSEFLSAIGSPALEKIDIKLGKHVESRDLSDSIAWRAVRGLRMIADTIFYKRYVHRAIVLETVAAIPGMVGGIIRHLRSLRNMEDDENIRVLLAEAENERMHLMTWMEVAKPLLIERLIVLGLQGVFFNAYLLVYVVSPKTAHRFVGYLEEEAVVSYTEMISEIKSGVIANVDAPEIAKKYWNLKEDAKLLDVTLAIRADEAMHRDTNHDIANEIAEGIE